MQRMENFYEFCNFNFYNSNLHLILIIIAHRIKTCFQFLFPNVQKYGYLRVYVAICTG